jgi:CheY-like chemotaxis protein
MDVLLVDDEPLVRAVAADTLREAGYVVVEAASAEEALAKVESATNGEPSVIVTDLHLGPGMDGLALGAEALRRWPEVRVIYATGYPNEFDGHLLGLREHYLVKPFSPAVLLQTVHRLMPTRGLAWLLRSGLDLVSMR